MQEVLRNEIPHLIGERRRRRKGERERRRGDATGGRLRGGESTILLRGDNERLRGGGDGDRPLRIGGAVSA